MAIKVGGTTVVDDSRQLTNITSVDATTVSALNSAGIVSDIVADTTPQLGGNLDLNSNNITGTGNVSITGSVTATSFSGDGSSLTGLGGIGSGQSWGLYTGSRSAGTTYTNTTGLPIMVSVYGQKTATNAIGQMAIAVDGTEVNRTFVTDGWAYGAFDCPASVVAIVPNNSTYQINLYNAAQLVFWAELR